APPFFVLDGATRRIRWSSCAGIGATSRGYRRARDRHLARPGDAVLHQVERPEGDALDPARARRDDPAPPHRPVREETAPCPGPSAAPLIPPGPPRGAVATR